jgi:uncharacterized protein RhaS with RHS repeats
MIRHPDPDGAGPLGSPTTSFRYHVDGSLESLSVFDSLDSASRMTKHFAYDALGRLIRETSPDPDGDGPAVAAETAYHYDVLGNRTGSSELIGPGRFVEYAHAFDNRNRLWRTTEIVAGQPVRETVLLYDRQGHVAGQQERIEEGSDSPAFRQTDFQYDALGRLIVQTEPASADGGQRPQTHFFYDAVGNLRFQRDANGSWTEFRYDCLGRVVTVVESATADHGTPVTRKEYTVR